MRDIAVTGSVAGIAPPAPPAIPPVPPDRDGPDGRRVTVRMSQDRTQVATAPVPRRP
ncbi:hypothetical protein [Streptomyces sp. NPDC059092]|uniref:hypothetical protein n=1 Tax=Streptomyces sp. NPDC059092 TaxID=3346725 RepID=UPI00369D30AC